MRFCIFHGHFTFSRHCFWSIIRYNRSGTSLTFSNLEAEYEYSFRVASFYESRISTFVYIDAATHPRSKFLLFLSSLSLSFLLFHFPLPHSPHTFNSLFYSFTLSSSPFFLFIAIKAVPANSNPPGYRSFNRSDITLTWPSPLGDGGYPIINYTLTSSLDGLQWLSFSIPASQNVYLIHFFYSLCFFYCWKRYYLSQLMPNTRYYFKIASSNFLGMSPESDVASIVTASCMFLLFIIITIINHSFVMLVFCLDGKCDGDDTCGNCITNCGTCGLLL